MAFGKSTFVSSTAVPDAASSIKGKGFSTTGLVRAPDGTWWVANDGLSDAADKTYSPSLVHLSSDFKTKIGEISLSGSDVGKVRSVQGLTYDTKDGTLWFASRSENKLYEVSTGGDIKQRLAVSGGTNGATYDSRYDAIWTAGAKDDDVLLISTKTGAVLKTFKLSRFDPDHLFVDTANDLLYYSYGDSGRAGNVVVMSLSTGKEVGRYQLAQADAIEGIWVQGSRLYVANNGFFHESPSKTNAILTFNIDLFKNGGGGTSPGGTSPAVAVTAITDDTGSSATDNITANGIITISGTAKSANGQSVSIKVDGKLVKTATVASDKWTLAGVDLGVLGDGRHTITASLPSGAVSASYVVTLDRVAPVAPGIVKVADSAGNASREAMKAGGTWKISGTAEAAALVGIFLDGKQIGSTTTAASGAWAFDADASSFTFGDHLFQAKAADAAGNVSGLGQGVEVTVGSGGSGGGTGMALSGGAGSTLVGGAGDDVLTVTGAPKLADGGVGNDLLIVSKSATFAADSIRGIEAVEVASGVNANFSALATGLIIRVSIGSSGAVTISGTKGSDQITGGNGDDRLDGMQGNDVLDGGKGNDRLTGGPGNDTLRGGEGDDFLEVKRGTGPDKLDGGAGVDHLVIDFAKVSKPLVLSLADPLALQVLSDGTTVTGIEKITVVGGTGNDTFTGGALSDVLNGYGGNDVLNGGGGNDTLVGGAGRDMFVFGPSWGGDVVTDFEDGLDILDFRGPGLTADKLSTTAVGADVMISVTGGTDFVRLAGIDINKIGAGDFLFV